MSMPQPIFVALIGATAERVDRAKKFFRLSTPGLGPFYLASLETEQSGSTQPLVQLPKNQITIWIALDPESFLAASLQHQVDSLNPRYTRGFYDELLPEPCVLVNIDQSPEESKRRLTDLAQKITSAWYASS
ncbi:hypothetical protein [Planctopirus hydrillae]|nr:hypothetical protein [Planctopirus hydrillae]